MKTISYSWHRMGWPKAEKMRKSLSDLDILFKIFSCDSSSMKDNVRRSVGRLVGPSPTSFKEVYEGKCINMLYDSLV